MDDKNMIMTADMKPDYEQEIIAIIRGNVSPRVMLNRLEDYHENDIAEVISDLTVQERKKFYRICPAEMLAEIFEYFDEDDAGKYLDEMDIRKPAGHQLHRDQQGPYCQAGDE